jgi:hypothetical protein
VLATLRTVTTQPIRYMLNSRHHGDHVSANVNVAAMGVDIIAHRNIRQNFLRLKHAGDRSRRRRQRTGVRQAIDKMLALDFEVAIPGHEKVLTGRGLRDG